MFYRIVPTGFKNIVEAYEIAFDVDIRMVYRIPDSGVPKSNLFTWIRNRKYDDVGKASPEVLSSRPAPEGFGDNRICTFVKVSPGNGLQSRVL